MRSQIYFATAALIIFAYFCGKYQINATPTQIRRQQASNEPKMVKLIEIPRAFNKNSGGKFDGSKRPETVRQQLLVTKKMRSPKQLISQHDRQQYIKKVAKNWTELASKMNAKFKQDTHFSPADGAVNVKQNEHCHEKTNSIDERTDKKSSVSVDNCRGARLDDLKGKRKFSEPINDELVHRNFDKHEILFPMVIYSSRTPI